MPAVSGGPGPLPLPRRLSPSRASDYAQCPKMFFHKTVEGRSEPPSVASTAGNLAHLIFERIFDLPAAERTLEWALSSVESSWVELCSVSDGMPPHLVEAARGYAALAPAGSAELSEIFGIVRASIEGWFGMESPSRFEPLGRELELEAEVGGVRFGGILDRLDIVEYQLTGEDAPRPVVVISDYKTGRPVRDDPASLRRAMGPMVMYAVLLEELARSQGPDSPPEIRALPSDLRVDLLRLVYVRTGSKELGVKRLRLTQADRDREVARMSAIRSGIDASSAANSWKPTVSALCAYCPFVSECPEGTAEVARRAALKAERAAREAQAASASA